MTGLEMKQIVNHSSVEGSNPKPMEIVGSGPLLSSIWKLGDVAAGCRYRFNVIRETSEKGFFTDLFQPQDLGHFIKLIQVLAAVIADDGCLSPSERRTLKNIATQLDEFLTNTTVKVNEHVPPAA
jgi:hypothetical protein